MQRPSYHTKYNNWKIDKAGYKGCADLTLFLANLGALEDEGIILINRLKKTNLGANKRAIMTSDTFNGKLIIEVALKTDKNDWTDIVEEAKEVCDLLNKKVEEYLDDKK